MSKYSDNAMRMLGQPSINEKEERIVDALTDLIHLCMEDGYDWERVVDQAEYHYDQWQQEEYNAQQPKENNDDPT